MSNRSRNLLATVAVVGMAAIASSQGLTTGPAQQHVAAVSPPAPLSANR